MPHGASAQRLGFPVESVNQKTLTKLLVSRKELVRLRGIGLIQTHPRLKYEHLDVLIEAADHHLERLEADVSPSPSLVATLGLIGSTSRPAAGEFLIKQLDSYNSEIVILVADILGTHQYREAIDAIGKLIDHAGFQASYAFRFTVVRSLWSMKSPGAVDLLLQWAPKLDGQLRVDLDRMLASVDASLFGGDESELAAWKEKQANQPVFQNTSYSTGGLDNPVFAKAEYYGIPIEAKRLLFILDHSSSMRDASGGYTRLEKARRELVSVISHLDPETEFAIMIFSNKTRLWRSELLTADDVTKQSAIGFVRRIGYGDKTNTYAALRQALTLDSSLEAVYLLSDGAPTLGDIVNPVNIVADVIHRNRFRHLRFHTIGVSVTGKTRAFLEALAAQSNGEFREVD